MKHPIITSLGLALLAGVSIVTLALGSLNIDSFPVSIQSGSSGSYTYSVSSTYANEPVVGVSWFNAARFCNWLGNGQGSGDMETGAYTLNGATQGIIIHVNPGAAVYIPSENEWYKAAYYNGANSTYSVYPNGKNTITQADANYWESSGVVDVGYGTGSSSGTFGQGGNAWEWNDAVSGSQRGLRGGSWASFGGDLASSGRYGGSGYGMPSLEDNHIGLALAPGDTVHLMTSRAQIPVGAATKEADAPTVFAVLEGPALIERMKDGRTLILNPR